MDNERRHGVEEVIKRLDQVEGTQQTLCQELREHVEEEAVDLKAHGSKLDAHGIHLATLSSDLGDIKAQLAKQKGFVAGMLFAITALGYVLVEGIKRIMGQST